MKAGDILSYTVTGVDNNTSYSVSWYQGKEDKSMECVKHAIAKIPFILTERYVIELDTHFSKEYNGYVGRLFAYTVESFPDKGLMRYI